MRVHRIVFNLPGSAVPSNLVLPRLALAPAAMVAGAHRPLLYLCYRTSLEIVNNQAIEPQGVTVIYVLGVLAQLPQEALT
jgi:hypothetical protein